MPTDPVLTRGGVGTMPPFVHASTDTRHKCGSCVRFPGEEEYCHLIRNRTYARHSACVLGRKA